MLTIESFKSLRIRGPALKSQAGVTGYQGDGKSRFKIAKASSNRAT
jgi:hypothetical protein